MRNTENYFEPIEDLISSKWSLCDALECFYWGWLAGYHLGACIQHILIIFTTHYSLFSLSSLIAADAVLSNHSCGGPELPCVPHFNDIVMSSKQHYIALPILQCLQDPTPLNHAPSTLKHIATDDLIRMM